MTRIQKILKKKASRFNVNRFRALLRTGSPGIKRCSSGNLLHFGPQGNYAIWIFVKKFIPARKKMNPLFFSREIHPLLQSCFAWVAATTTKICTSYNHSRLAHAKSPLPWLLRHPTRYCIEIKCWDKKKIVSAIAITASSRLDASAPSIFGASPFGKWVVTHSLAGADFHGHRLSVYMN